jgi:23S rRNA pseudouridine1911/1915/1917 synthase
MARTDKALGRLTTLFREKKVEKKYLALVLKMPAQTEGELVHYLFKDEKRNVVTAYLRPKADAKESITRYRVLGQEKGLIWLEVEPVTGRPHQIRAQLSAMGCSILGDVKYGAPTPLADASIGLHCISMALEHPVQRVTMRWEAMLPPTAWWRADKSMWQSFP